MRCGCVVLARRKPSLPACMQQNGSSGSNGSEGCSGRERQPLSSFSPIPAATTRVRRFIQERRTLPLPKVMVVFSAAGETDKPSDAMSSSVPAEEEGARKPVSPSPSKTLRSSLNSQVQEVGRFGNITTSHTQSSKQLRISKIVLTNNSLKLQCMRVNFF